LSAVLNGRAGISPEMGVRLFIAFDSSAERWLNQQLQYDQWQVGKRRISLRVTRIAA
jgi:addiction module HigA family antidote